jgi:putative glutamine amidotransferase
MSMRPLIGITADILREPGRESLWNAVDYFRAVQRAGGIPVLLPYCETEAEATEIVARLDGILFSGGNDVDPLHFGEQPHPHLGLITPERDQAELLLARAALARDLPVLGICRGHQLLAVAAGGTLWQDVPSQVPGAIKHRQEAPRWYPTHEVEIVPGSRLAAILGERVRVNSYHHQAVRTVPPGWTVTAVAPDGINEGMELPGGRFVLSVQWHPETFTGRSYNFDRLFTAFVTAAAQARR